jgi:hypothetical protein
MPSQITMPKPKEKENHASKFAWNTGKKKKKAKTSPKST